MVVCPFVEADEVTEDKAGGTKLKMASESTEEEDWLPALTMKCRSFPWPGCRVQRILV
jgi:hypothetical protein